MSKTKRANGEKVEYKHLWQPFRYGLWLRKKLLKYSSSYGRKASLRFMSRRWIAVFISTLLDDEHQETIKGTPHHNFAIKHE